MCIVEVGPEEKLLIRFWKFLSFLHNITKKYHFFYGRSSKEWGDEEWGLAVSGGHCCIRSSSKSSLLWTLVSNYSIYSVLNSLIFKKSLFFTWGVCTSTLSQLSHENKFFNRSTRRNIRSQIENAIVLREIWQRYSILHISSHDQFQC